MNHRTVVRFTALIIPLAAGIGMGRIMFHRTPSPTPAADPSAALQKPALFERTQAIFAAGKDAAACRLLLDRADPVDTAGLTAIAERWASADPASLMDYLREHRPGLLEDRAVMAPLCEAWARRDPDAALAAVKKIPKILVRESYVRELLGNLLYCDRAKALEVSAGLADRHRIHLPDEFKGWVEGDYAGAARLIVAMPRSNFRLANALNLAERWGNTDPAAAMDFVQQLGSGYVEHGVERVLNGWIARDLDGARQYIESKALPGARARLGPQVAAAMAAKNPHDAAVWTRTHLSGRAQAEAFVALVGAGAIAHPKDAADIAASLPAGPTKDRAIRAVAEKWFVKNPQLAGAWAASLPRGYIAGVLQTIAHLNLPEEQKQSVRKQLSPK